MGKFGRRAPRKAEPSPKAEPRKQSRKATSSGARVFLSGELFEEQRKELTRHPDFPRKAYYAFSLTHGIARLDGKDEVGEMLGDSGVSLRGRVVNAWQKMGNVVVMYEGAPRLAVLVE